jgi:hypothetical protein
MARSFLWLLAAAVLASGTPAGAAEIGGLSPRGPAIMEQLEVPPPVTSVGRPVTGPLAPAPPVQYGCHRIWRCDATICEWRRGCWGVYGYVEGPYYTSAFARRQWESHGWPNAHNRRDRYR